MAGDPRTKAEELLAALRDPEGRQDDANRIAISLLDAVDERGGATAPPAADAMRTLLGGLEALGEPGPIGKVMIVVGPALDERGADPAPAAGPLVALLEGAAGGDVRLLDRGWPALIALFSRDPSARERARGLRPLLLAIDEDNEAAHWLACMLDVLHEEPFVAIEPGTGTGLRGRMSGIADNFQLHILLMDSLPAAGRFIKRSRVSAAAAACARGEGPQQLDETVVGAWNMYTHHAWRGPSPELDATDHETWIWGEGTPADIPTLDGHRVILLGPPSYTRSFGVSRMFPSLPATLAASPLERGEVREWLARIAATS